uniref:Uncharacterized protein n=1 Tax=Arundo donax TaxID=35708 RepID=A0A0A9BM05_ARUDO
MVYLISLDIVHNYTAVAKLFQMFYS